MKNCHSVSERISIKSVPAFAKRHASVLSFIILLLPKCPLCLAAYSGVVALCGTTALITNHTDPTDWRAYIALVISIGITGCILFSNRAGKYYKMTLIMALSGLLFICISLSPKNSAIFKKDAMACYYAGAILLVAATFIYSRIYRKLFEILKVRGFAT
jgi:phosphoglycerol transferase MdoB-like AlkP superfamily enzyme